MLKWGSAGSGVGQFNFPEGIDVDASDKVYVADFSNQRIQKFDGNGTFIEAWTTPSGLRPLDVAVDTGGQVYAGGPNEIQRFSCGCGNGIVDAGEQCDDGNVTAGDACSPRCVPALARPGLIVLAMLLVGAALILVTRVRTRSG